LKVAKSNYPNNYADYDIDESNDRVQVTFDRECIAGNYVLMQVVITLCQKLLKGEGIAVMAPYGFTLPQLTLPTSPGYTTVEASSEVKLRLSPYLVNKVSFERGVIAWLEEGELEKGDSLNFKFGDAAQGSPGMRASLQAHRGLLVACYRMHHPERAHPPILQNSPRISVNPGNCVLVRGFATPTLGVGEKGKLVLVAEDRFGNRAENFGGEITLRGIEAFPDLPKKISFSANDQGRREYTFTASRKGLFRPIVCHPQGDVTAGPIEVSRETSEYKLYFGELHAHSEISYDAAGSLDELYTFARDTACLDFAAATDHMTATVGQDGYAEHPGGIPGIHFDRFPGRWEATAEASQRYHQPGRFITFLGFEFAPSGHTGHRNVYFPTDDPELIELPAWPPPEGFLGKWAKGRKDIIVIPHHPAIVWGAGVFPDSKGLEIATIPEEIQPFVEIYSKHGTSEYFHNPRPLRGQTPGYFVQDMLEAGAHIGLVGGSDSHQANPGSSLEEPGPYRTLQYRSGLAAVWAKDLSRQSLWEAFLARRVYATSYPRVILRFWVNDIFMGQVGKAPYPRQIRVFLAAPTFVNYVQLIKNGQVIATEAGAGHRRMPADVEGEILFKDETPSDRPEDYYYLRVQLHGTERIWSSPVWVRR